MRAAASLLFLRGYSLMICSREVLEKAAHKLSDDGTSVTFVTEHEDGQLVDDTGEEDYLVKDTDDTTCHPAVIDQTDTSSVNHEQFRVTESNLEATSDCTDLWTLDESPVEWPKEFCVNDETLLIDQDVTRVTERWRLGESNEHGCNTHTLDKVDGDLCVSDTELPKPISYAALRWNCRAMNSKLSGAAACGQFSDAEEDESVELLTGTSARTAV